MLPPVPENHPSVYMCRHSSDANDLASLTPFVSMYPPNNLMVSTSFPFAFPTAPSNSSPPVAAEEDDGESNFLTSYMQRNEKRLVSQETTQLFHATNPLGPQGGQKRHIKNNDNDCMTECGRLQTSKSWSGTKCVIMWACRN